MLGSGIQMGDEGVAEEVDRCFGSGHRSILVVEVESCKLGVVVGKEGDVESEMSD